MLNDKRKIIYIDKHSKLQRKKDIALCCNTELKNLRISCTYIQINIGKKLHCQLELKNYHSEKVITLKTEKGDVVDHILNLLAQALVAEIASGKHCIC